MDPLIAAAALALSAGDPLMALKRIALRDDAQALAVRGIAMAQLGDLKRARELLRIAARAFGPKEAAARARCLVAEAEIARVSRDLGRPSEVLEMARATLAAAGDRINAAHAGYLEVRRLLVIGRLDQAEAMLEEVEASVLPPVSRAGLELAKAGLAMRRIRTEPASAALERARRIAATAGIASLSAEVDRARQAFAAPAARLVTREGVRSLSLADVEALLATDTLIVDACRNIACAGPTIVPLATRAVLLALLRALAEIWPADASRETLLDRAFGAGHADESHRARLRVEIARLRQAIRPLAALKATERGFLLKPGAGRRVAVLAPPVEGKHPDILALLGDGQAWSSSALALALGVSARTVQRALETLAADNKVECFGRGRASRWIASNVPGFPTSLLLPVVPMPV